MSSHDGIITIGIVVTTSVLLLLGLLLFSSSARSAMLLSLMIVIMVVIVSLITYVSLSSTNTSGTKGSTFPVNFHNLDPGLEKIVITLPDKSNLVLNRGESLYGYNLHTLDKLEAEGRSVGKTYDNSYTLNDISNTDVFFSTDGAKTAKEYIPLLTVDNIEYDGDVTLYGSDENSVFYELIKIGANDIGYTVSFLQQKLSLDSSGAGSIEISSPSNNVILVSKDGKSISFKS